MLTSDHAAVHKASLLPTAILALAFLAVFIAFATSTASWYATFKSIHVLFVVIWVGGGAFLTAMGLAAERARDTTQLAAITRMAAFAGERIFPPAAIVVFVMGVLMQANIHAGYSPFWLVFGLLGFAATFVIGIAILAPASKRLKTLIEEKGIDDPACMAAISRILLIARVDIAVLLLVIADMVVKPFS